jgi:hypothetical protein
MGGLLTLDAFVRAFPQMDTLHTKGEAQLYNSNIQGLFPNFTVPFPLMKTWTSKCEKVRA